MSCYYLALIKTSESTPGTITIKHLKLCIVASVAQKIPAIIETNVAATEEELPIIESTEEPIGVPLESLSANIYGFVMADMIYDFKRVDPNWNDTLRVSTIPTEDGAYGSDGEFVFGVRQSRLGIKGNYGDDITYILEAELFGVGGDEGQTTPRLRHAWATYKNFGMGQYWSNFTAVQVTKILLPEFYTSSFPVSSFAIR